MLSFGNQKLILILLNGITRSKNTKLKIVLDKAYKRVKYYNAWQKLKKRKNNQN